MLKAVLRELNKPRDFDVGDFVTWKDEILRNALYPKGCKDFGICVRFEAPVRGDNDPASSQFCDWKDMVVGVIGDRGDYGEFIYSSRRMKKYVE